MACKCQECRCKTPPDFYMTEIGTLDISKAEIDELMKSMPDVGQVIEDLHVQKAPWAKEMNGL